MTRTDSFFELFIKVKVDIEVEDRQVLIDQFVDDGRYCLITLVLMPLSLSISEMTVLYAAWSFIVLR